MWLSRARRARGEHPAMVGRTTLEGDPAGAWLDGERRMLPVFAPGGYVWKPALGQELLVLKGGPGEPSCVAGTRAGDGAVQPGEVLIRAQGAGASIRLKNNGRVELNGQIIINGVPLMDLIRRG